MAGPPQLNSEVHPIILQNYWVLHGEHSLVSITKTKQLVLFTEMITVCCNNHTRNVNALCGQNVQFLSQRLLHMHTPTTVFVFFVSKAAGV